MEKFVINIGRQLGSGGKAIGVLLSEAYGIPVYDKRLLKIAAKESGFGEKFFEEADEKHSGNSSLLTMMMDYIRSPFLGDMYDNVLGNDTLFKIQSDVIRNLAEKESCIFVGRCADYILRDYPRVVNIFITADMADRVRRISELQNVSAGDAEKIAEKADARRSSYYNYYSSKIWGAADSYHLCVNSSVLGEEKTAEYIKEFIDRKLGL